MKCICVPLWQTFTICRICYSWSFLDFWVCYVHLNNVASYLSNSEVALFRSCQIHIVLTLLLREVLVICDNGQICESFIASGVGGAHYHNCHLKPSPLPSQWNPYQPLSSYLDLAVFWRPVVFPIHIYQQSYFQRKRHHCHLKPSPRYALQSTLLMAVATRGCACVRHMWRPHMWAPK